MLEFTCPRCGAEATSEFYGPCRNCVVSLHAGQALDRSAMAVADYVPKMNVTPNAVATKE
jgi:hypothetical protein